MTSDIFQRLRVKRGTFLIYIVFYYSWGFAMNEIGIYAEIARFVYRFQIITCYIFFMIPLSLYLRRLHWFQQYAYGVVFMGLFEFGGYALETSIAYPDNILDQLFGIRNFSLGMTLFFGAYFPIGNWAVSRFAGLMRIKKDD